MTDEQQFRIRNHEIIQGFMKECAKRDDDISGSVQATIAQFLLNVRHELHIRAKGQTWVSNLDIVEAQIQELRRCIVDLEQCKETITKGVRIQ
jgi:hypothetical protein